MALWEAEPSYKETGQYAFEAYARVAGDMRSWAQLGTREQDAWREAAHEVFRRGWREDVHRRRLRMPSMSNPAASIASRR